MAGDEAPRSAEQGAEIEVKCALIPEDADIEALTGKFWFGGEPHPIDTDNSDFSI
jgi:hypothetical protein